MPDPAISGPHDVIVRIGGAGLCRTDLHIYEGQWAEKTDVKLPYTIGHENAELAELMALAARGSVTLHTTKYPLDAVNDAMDDLEQGRLQGRGIFVPNS